MIKSQYFIERTDHTLLPYRLSGLQRNSFAKVTFFSCCCKYYQKKCILWLRRKYSRSEKPKYIWFFAHLIVPLHQNQSTSMKRFLPVLTWLGALLLIAFALIFFESDLLWKVQHYNLFLDTPHFFREQMVVPGGFLS